MALIVFRMEESDGGSASVGTTTHDEVQDEISVVVEETIPSVIVDIVNEMVLPAHTHGLGDIPGLPERLEMACVLVEEVW